MTTQFDALVIGAGAAGLFCAAEIGRSGLSVCVIDHAGKPAEKVRISGGGRCNFTNLHVAPERFLPENPHFAKSALARYTPADFCALLARHGITWHEKTLGQLFCDGKSGAVIAMLLAELSDAGGVLRLDTPVSAPDAVPGGFRLAAKGETLTCRSLVIATGGLSIPAMKASGYAYDVARAFGHAVVTPRPGLVPFTFSGEAKNRFAALSGVSVPARVTAGNATFEEAILFTHRGLSGPAVLQASSYWTGGEPVTLDLVSAGKNLPLASDKAAAPRKTLAAALAARYPKRLAESLAGLFGWPGEARLGDLPDATLAACDEALAHWPVTPAGTEGWRTAEVTVGGVSTADLSSKTLESRRVPGLYFIGECVDVTGWLGGYNFQWAWASAMAAGRAIGAP